MRRSILTSLVVIGSVVALVVGASTFAVFTDEETISSEAGDIASATLDLVLEDDGATSISFSPVDAADCTNMAPGDACDTDFTVENGGTIEFRYSGEVTENGDPNECFAAVVSFVGTNSSIDAHIPSIPTGTTFALAEADHGGADTDDALDPGEVDTYRLTVTLEPDATNTCQSQNSVVYTITVDATQSTSPHD